MTRLIFAMMRVCLVTGVALVVLAIVIGRNAEVELERRERAVPRYQPISGHLFEGPNTGLRLLDLETGALEPVRLPAGGTMKHAAMSPWRDGRGRTHVAGLWNAANARGGEPATALVRFAVPGWELLDRVEVEA